MTRKWVLNASPLIVLSRISCVDIVVQLCSEIVIPAGVADEIMRGGVADPARIWLKAIGRAYVRNVARVEETIAGWDLGLGESHVLTYAYVNHGYEAVLDDRAARTCATALDIPVRGTLGVLLLAKREGVIIRMRPLLEAMVQTGFHLGPEVTSACLRLAREAPLDKP